MHFLFTAPRYHTNQRFAVKALLDAGHRVTFVALRKQHSEVYDELEPVVLGETRIAPWLPGGERRCPPPADFWRMVRELRPDAVVARDPYSAYWLLSAMAGRLSGARVIYYSQYRMHRQLARWKAAINSMAARTAGAKWITPVLGSPERHPQAFGALRYVPFVMEPQTPPKDREWFRRGAVNVMTVGKFYRRKNHSMFLEVIGRLSGRYRVTATIIGECTSDENRRELARIEEIRDALDLGERVRIKTNLPYHEVQREYAAHDLFVLPSSDEPAAVSHLEAMSHSLPVICSDSNGTRCYVRQGENGYVFKTGDGRDLEDRMESIVADRSRLVDMGVRSHELVVSQHSPTKYVETMEALARGEG